MSFQSVNETKKLLGSAKRDAAKRYINTTVHTAGDAAVTLTTKDAGKLVISAVDEAVVYTLPTTVAADVGLWYDFYLSADHATTFTITAPAAATIHGAVAITVSGATIVADQGAGQAVQSGANNSLDLDSTAGDGGAGLTGTHARFVCIAADTWLAKCVSRSTPNSTEASVWSA